MTEHDLAVALKDLSKTVVDLRIDVVKSVTTLRGEVRHLGDAHHEVATQVKEIALNQASCAARTGQEGVNARLKKLEKKISDDKIEVKSELDKYREDHTGNIDEVALKAARLATGDGHRDWGALAARAVPWLIMGLIGLGVWLGSGGDEERVKQVLNNVREIGIKVEKLEREIPPSTEEWETER
jgi:hypothetical protein